MDHDEELDLLNRLHDRMQGQERPPGSDGIQFDEDLRCLRLMLTRRAAEKLVEAAEALLKAGEGWRHTNFTESDGEIVMLDVNGTGVRRESGRFIVLVGAEAAALESGLDVLREAVDNL